MNIYNIFPIGQNIVIPQLSDLLQQQQPYFHVIDVMQGGMGGCVHIKAEDGNEYALKIILPDKFESEESYKRYITELKKWRTFSMCDGVLETHGLIEHNAIPCAISPWMKQGDLGSLMKIREQTVFYNTAYRIVGTLKWVYDTYKTIHRDIKPNNILVDENYLPYIADWGLCKTLDDSKGDTQKEICKRLSDFKTREGYAIGTWGYASPEQMCGDKNIDFRTDIFAIGVIMYMWETGRHPFQGETFEETIQNIQYGRYTELRDSRRYSIFGADTIIDKCLAHNPQDRYSSYNELLNDLESYANYVPAFIKYEPNVRRYVDLVNPQNLINRLSNKDISGIIGNGVVVIDQDYVIEQSLLATNLTQIGEYKKALEIISRVIPPEKTLRDFPDLPIHQSIIINYAHVLHKNGLLDEAIKWILKLSHGLHLPTSYYVNLSLFYIDKMMYKECLKTCEQGLNISSDDVDLLGNATLAATALELFGEASQFANHRIKIDHSLQANYEYAFLCYHWGESLKETDFPQAIRLYKSSLLYYRRALEYNPKHYASNLNMAIVLFKLKRFNDSLEVLTKINISEASLYWMSKNFQWVGSSDNCLDFCKKWLAKNPNFLMLNRTLSETMVDEYVINKPHNGKRFIEKDSWDFFESIVNNKAHRLASDLRYYGRLLQWRGDIDLAISFFHWAEQVFPKEWTYNYYLSYSLLWQNKYQEALEQAKIANRKAPWRENSYKLLSECYRMLGNLEQSQKYLAKQAEIESQKVDLYNSCKFI